MKIFHNYKIVFLALLIGMGAFFTNPQPANALAPFNSVFSATAPTSLVSTLRQMRLDPVTEKLYLLTSSTTVLSVFSADGSSLSSINYSTPLSNSSLSDFVISSNTAFIVTSQGGSGNTLRRFDISGSIANLISSTTLAVGAPTISYTGDGNLYVGKGTGIHVFNTTGTAITPTSSLSLTPSRTAYDPTGGLIYVASTKRLYRTIFDGADTALSSSTIGTGTSTKSLVVSNDGSAVYYADNDGISKYSVIGSTYSSLLWTISFPSNLAGIDLNSNTGKIFALKTNGEVYTYDPINPITSTTIYTSSSNAVLSWTNDISDTDFGGVTIRRSTTGFPTSITDGLAVTSSAMTTNFTDANLSDGTYYYTLFNKTIDGYYSTGATSSVIIDTTPPDAPILIAESNGSTANLSWTVPAETASFMLRVNTTGYPISIYDGTTITTTDFSVSSLSQNSLTDGTHYYSIFAADEKGNYSSAGTSSVMIDTTAPASPSGFSAVASSSSINLSWTNPIDSDFAFIVLRRSTSTFPVSTTDGQMVATGTQTNFTDSDLSDGTYYYSIFSADTTGNISNSATASATVNTYVAPPAHTIRSGIGSSDSSNTTSANGNISNNLPASPTVVASINTAPTSTGPTDEAAAPAPTAITATTTTIIPPTTTNPVFLRTLRQGIRGDDVKALQVFLNTHGFLVAKNGAGSLGNETNFYGSATAKAVKQFQENNKTDILKPYNLEKGTGIFGPTTMRFVNQILLK